MSADEPQALPDLRYVRELARVFKQYELGEIEIEAGDQRILLRRGQDGAAPTLVAAAPTVTAAPAAAPTPAPAAAPTPTPAAAPEGTYILSPFVGTFYRSSNPDTPSFVEVGQSVSVGQTLCIVEAMKLFNELEAEFPCVIEEILIDNAQAVEYGARLFKVRRL